MFDIVCTKAVKHQKTDVPFWLIAFVENTALIVDVLFVLPLHTMTKVFENLGEFIAQKNNIITSRATVQESTDKPHCYTIRSSDKHVKPISRQ